MSTTKQSGQAVRLGVIGTGLAVKKLHWPALRQMPDRFTIVAFADTNRANAEDFAGYSGVSLDAYAGDADRLLERRDVEAVLVSLPIPLSYEVTRACLQAGKHVICEKPPGANLEQGRDFLALADQFPDQKVLIAENFFYRDDLRLARSLLDEGAIGRLNVMAWRMASHFVPQEGGFSSTPWRQQPQYRGGPHLDGGVHMIAQIRLLCGDAQRVHGLVQYANAAMGGPSDLILNLSFVGGAIGNYTSIHSEIPVPREGSEMRLYGREAVMTIGRRTVSLHRPDGSVEEHRVEGSDGGYYNEFVNFHEAVAHDEPIVGTIAQSFHNMLIVLRGLDSAEGSGVVELDDAPGGLAESSVPLWRPRGAKGLFDGLPCKITRSVRRA